MKTDRNRANATKTEPRTAPRSHEPAPRPRRHRRMSPEEIRDQKIAVGIVLYVFPVIAFLLGMFAMNFWNNLQDRNEIRDYGRELHYSAYTVQYGDTMWDIAVEMAALNPEYTDIRQYLHELQSVNQNYGDHLQEGTQILIPYYATPAEKMRGGGSLEEEMITVYAKYNIIQYDRLFQMLSGN